MSILRYAVAFYGSPRTFDSPIQSAPPALSRVLPPPLLVAPVRVDVRPPLRVEPPERLELRPVLLLRDRLLDPRLELPRRVPLPR